MTAKNGPTEVSEILLSFTTDNNRFKWCFWVSVKQKKNVWLKCLTHREVGQLRVKMAQPNFVSLYDR